MIATELRGGRRGPLVLCSDGLAGTWPDWLPLADALPDLRLVAVVRDEESLDEAAAELIGVLDRFEGERAVLIGHSMGGFVVEAAARLAPDRVAGLVLLDASVTPAHPVVSVLDRLGGAALRATAARSDAVARGAARVRRRFDPSGVRDDVERRALVDPINARPEHWAVIASELVAYQDWARRVTDLRPGHDLPPVPIRVITAARAPWGTGWVRRQGAYAQLLRADPGRPTVRHHVVRSGHLVQLERPEAVATLIEDLWA